MSNYRMTVHQLGLIFPFVLTLAAPVAHAHAAEPDEAAPFHGTPVELAVNTGDVDDLGSRGFNDEIKDALTERLTAAGFEVVHDGADARIEAIVETLEDGERDYALSFDVVVDGQREVIHDAIECAPCSQRQVVERSTELIDDAVGFVPLRPSPAPVQEMDSEPRSTKVSLGPLGFSGALTIVGGAASIIGGIVLATQPSEYGEPCEVGPDGEVISMTDGSAELKPRPVGGALIGVGTLFAAAGVAALLVDLKVLEPRRQRRVDVALDVSRTRAGLMFSGRF